MRQTLRRPDEYEGRALRDQRRGDPAYKVYSPRWEREVAKIAAGQSKACRAAIHRYWLASRKSHAANLIYLNASHPGVTIAQIGLDLNDEPYSTLKSLTEEAKSHAIRVCG